MQITFFKTGVKPRSRVHVGYDLVMTGVTEVFCEYETQRSHLYVHNSKPSMRSTLLGRICQSLANPPWQSPFGEALVPERPEGRQGVEELGDRSGLILQRDETTLWFRLLSYDVLQICLSQRCRCARLCQKIKAVRVPFDHPLSHLITARLYIRQLPSHTHLHCLKDLGLVQTQHRNILRRHDSCGKASRLTVQTCLGAHRLASPSHLIKKGRG